ncbi:MAG: TolC family protein [Victivallales bacterium]
MTSLNKKYLALCVSSATVLFSGCYNYPGVPDAVNQSTYTDLKRDQQQRLPDDCKVLTLDTAEQISVANNPNYLAMSHSVNAAWSRFYASLSAYFPTIDATYGFSNNRLIPSSGEGGGNKPSFSKGGGLQGQWLLFDGLVREMNMLIAKHNAKQTEALDRDARRLLLLSVAQAYNNILLARENIRIAESDADFNEKLYNETELKYKVGEVSLSEPLNFKVKYNQAKNQLIISNYSFITSKYILAALLGLTESDIPANIEFPPLSPKNEQFSSDITVYLDTALANRPDLDAFREALLSANFNVWSKWGAFSPTISANGFYGYLRTDTGTGKKTNWSSRSQDRSYNYGLTASWTLFNGGQNWFNLKESQALLAQSQLAVVTKWIQVVSEVRQAQENYRQAIEQVTLFEETLGLVQKTRDLVEEEYKAGNANLTRVNQAQSDLVRAEADLASSRVNLENAKAQMEAAIGSR